MKLTKKELDILVTHFLCDFDYGVGGTWGDGDSYDDPKERAEGKKLANKLRKIWK